MDLLYLLLRWGVLKGISHPLNSVGWTTMALTWPSLLWFYLRHLLLPIGLSGFYGIPYMESAARRGVIVPVLLVGAVLWGASWVIRRLQDPRLGILAFFWTVLPILPVLYLRAFAQGDIAHDRYLYLPSIGFVWFVALALQSLWASLRRPAAGGALLESSRRPGIVMVAVGAIGVAYALGTVTQQLPWASNLLLYSRAVRIAPSDNLALNNLANELIGLGRPSDAIALYSELRPHGGGGWYADYHLGYAYYKLGQAKAAEMFFRRAIQTDASDPDQFVYLGLCLMQQERLEEAAQSIQHAIQIRPAARGYHFALGMIRHRQGNLAEAESEFMLELKNNPQNEAARRQLEGVRAAR